MNSNASATLSIQWHITSKCKKHCRHCYMYESERYKTEIENELTLPEMIKILDDLEAFEEKWNFKIKDFFITGGDPILCDSYHEFMKILKQRNKRIYVMGNPETLDDANLKFLKEIGVQQFQMSLDGLRETHDYYRGKGSFDLTINALQRLDEYGIKGTIMFTLTGENKSELIPLMNYVAYNSRAKGFAFDLVCGVGNAKNIKLQLNKEDIKQIYEDYLEEKKKIRSTGNMIRLSEKSKFFQLLHYENDDFYPYDHDDFAAAGGCYVGYTCSTILSDGSVAACRRFPTLIGKLPDEKFEDIFLGNELLKKFRRPSSFESCGNCMFYKYCRGCPAVSYGYSSDPFATNQLCFVDKLKKDVIKKEWNSVKINTTKEEEANIIRSLLSNQYAFDYNKFISNDDALMIIGTLLNEPKERKMFFSNPDAYVFSKTDSLSKKDIAYICYYIESVMQSRIPNPIKYALNI